MIFVKYKKDLTRLINHSSDMSNSSHQSERAKARWSILRKALLNNDGRPLISCNNTNRSDKKATSISSSKEHSIHRFAGFQMLKRRTIPKEDLQNMLLLSEIDEKTKVEGSQESIVVEYEMLFSSLDSPALSKITVRTLERETLGMKLSMKELMSHVHFGVDNTGNTRVWDCSNVLAFLVMGEKDVPPVIEALHQAHEFNYSTDMPFVGLKDVLSLATDTNMNGINERKLLRVLELGAGMAALPSLALAALDLKYRNKQETSVPRIHVTITDGHPNAVENNVSCSQLTQQLYECNNDTNGIRCHSLLWKANNIGKQECDEVMKNMSSSETMMLSNCVPFDLMLVSDCTHFSDFHADLAATIGRMLRINGICLLCQPRRSASLRKFIQVLDAMNEGEHEHGPLFQVDLHQKYSKEIYDRHRQLLNEKNDIYDATIHYPLLLVLKKLREYHEDQDTCKAISFVKMQMDPATITCIVPVKV